MGGTCLILHPRFLFGALELSAYETYQTKNRVRYNLSYKAMSEMMITNSLVKIKESPPYTKELEGPVLLNSLARASYDPKTGSYAFASKLATQPIMDLSNVKALSEILSVESTAGVGVDHGEVSVVIGSL